ncbi:hypothetical protein NC652_038513 [Populus alba x Populus x berolinensis]|nr:hypothetical protein NC652_038513 [Populus alba x Populus x berolinensis]
MILMSFFIRFPEEKVEELLHNHLHPLSAGSSSFTSLNRQSILCNLEGRVGVADAVWVLTVCSLPVSNSSLLPVARPALYVKVVF